MTIKFKNSQTNKKIAHQHPNAESDIYSHMLNYPHDETI